MTDLPRTLIAMRLPLHQEAAAAAIERHVDVAGAASDVASTLELLGETTAQVVIAEFGLPGGGTELCAAIKADDRWSSEVRVLIVGSERDDDDELVEAVHAGADGFVSERESVAALDDAVQRVSRGEASIPGEMLGSLLRTLIRNRREEDLAVERFARLSAREREVLALIVEGLDNAAIGERMTVSPNTARTHVQNILRKLDVRSRLEAASVAREFGLLDRFSIEGKEQDR